MTEPASQPLHIRAIDLAEAASRDHDPEAIHSAFSSLLDQLQAEYRTALEKGVDALHAFLALVDVVIVHAAHEAAQAELDGSPDDVFRARARQGLYIASAMALAEAIGVPWAERP
jgi:hypothetical protein